VPTLTAAGIDKNLGAQMRRRRRICHHSCHAHRQGRQAIIELGDAIANGDGEVRRGAEHLAGFLRVYS
jgi:hypothetical protein